jgi:hypothetical protein
MSRPRPAILSRVAAALLVLTLLVSYSPSRVRARLTAPGNGGFDFDPAYRAFLEGVAATTPRESTVAMWVPVQPDTYLYRAVYSLAPRRVVGPERATEAGFVAVYSRSDRTDAPSPSPRARALPGGFLQRR